MEIAEGTVLQEERRNEGERSLTTKNTKATKIAKMGSPFDWPPRAACRDVRGRRYKPHRRHRRLVSVPSYLTAVGALPRADQSNGSPFVFAPSFLL